MSSTDAIKKLTDDISDLKDLIKKSSAQLDKYKSELKKAQSELDKLKKLTPPPTPSPVPAPTPQPTPTQSKKPSDIIDLTNWYITTPFGKPGSPECIYQPALNSFVHDKYFYVNETGDAVVFVANCGGVTTKGSSYPRSELREMKNNGKDQASWTTSSGKHTMTVVESIHHLPKVKNHVVCAQYHDKEDDCVEIGLRGNKLIAFHDTTVYGTLDDNYQLGTKFTLKLVVEKDKTSVYYNDMTTPKLTASTKYSGCYWKAGCYTQSNTSKGDATDDYAEVHIYSLKVEHTQ